MSDNKKDTLKGELVAHGADNYLHEPSKSMNYYAQIRTDDGTISERWGKDLEAIIKDSGVQVGDNIVLTQLGKEPIQVGDKTFNKTIWDLQKYEPVLDLPNVIEHDSEREQQQAVTTDKTKENEEDVPNQPKKTPNLSDFEFELPSNIKNNYIAIVKNRHLSDQKINYYDKDDKDQVNIAFEDRNKSLHTSRQDEKTIYAMLDMAQSKGWSDIKLKGTEEFKQKAWLEASLRGIGVKGYEPNEKDLAELQAKQQARTTNQVEMTAQKAPETKQEDIFNENVDELQNNNTNIDYKEIAKDIAIEAGVTAVTPTPLQPVVAGAFLAKDVKEAVEFAKENLTDSPQKSSKNDRFTFEPMTALDVGIGDSEHLRQATHIADRETGEHYIIGNYDFEYNGEVHTGIIAEYYTNDKALTERDDNALIGGERVFYKLGIDDKLLISHIDGDNKLTAEEIDKLVSLERLRDTVSNQPVMPTKEFQVVSDNAKQAGFDSKELSLAQTAMLNNYTVAWDRLDQSEKYERLAMSIESIDDKKYNTFIDNLQKNINQDLSYLKQESKDISQEPIAQKSAIEIKNDIRQIVQNGYRDGSIKSRDEIVLALKERGFEVKENEKSISVSLPNSNQYVNLKGEMFTKGYDAIKSLKESLEPEKLKQTYPTLKDSDIVHITAYKNKLFDDNKNNPKVLQASLVQLETGVKELAKGKELNLPNLPINEIKPDVQVRTTDSHDKSRQM